MNTNIQVAKVVDAMNSCPDAVVTWWLEATEEQRQAFAEATGLVETVIVSRLIEEAGEKAVQQMAETMDRHFEENPLSIDLDDRE